jgi:putative DNA primase/helicase
MELPAFLELLSGVQPYQNGYNARCPAHDDGHASLSVSAGEHGRILVHCHAGCHQDDVVKALELSFADLSPAPHVVAQYPYTDSQGRVLWTVERWEPKDFRVRPKLPLPSQRVLYAAGWISWARANGQPILVVEGEKDADAAHAKGLAATTCVGGANKWLDHYSTELAGLHVTVVADNDEPGKRHAQAVYQALTDVAASVRLLKPRAGKDLSDHFGAGFGIADLDPLGRGGKMPRYRGSDLAVEPVRWAWTGHMPLGAITVIDGDPGDGKSVLTCDLAARWSSGLPMPDGSANPFGGPVSVIMVCAEDDLKATVAPRLRAHGADMSRITLISMGSEEGAPFSLGTNLSDLEEAVAEENAKAVILDPLMAYLPDGTDSSGDSSVRRALAPLMLMAHRRGVTIPVVRHMNKSGSGKAIYRGGGSIAFSGLARAAFLVTRHPDDPDARVLAAVKQNLAPKPPSLVYRLSSDSHYHVARINWEGEHAASAQELLDGGDNQEVPASEVTEHLLRLCTEPMPWREIVAEGKAAGYSEKSLLAARGRVLEKIFGTQGNRDVTWRAKYGLAGASLARGLRLLSVPEPTSAAVSAGQDPLPHSEGEAALQNPPGVSPDDAPVNDKERRDADLAALPMICQECGEPGVKFADPHWRVSCRAHHPDYYTAG